MVTIVDAADGAARDLFFAGFFLVTAGAAASLAGPMLCSDSMPSGWAANVVTPVDAEDGAVLCLFFAGFFEMAAGSAAALAGAGASKAEAAATFGRPRFAFVRGACEVASVGTALCSAAGSALAEPSTVCSKVGEPEPAFPPAPGDSGAEPGRVLALVTGAGAAVAGSSPRTRWLAIRADRRAPAASSTTGFAFGALPFGGLPRRPRVGGGAGSPCSSISGEKIG
jgi:hypothetical protein